MKRYIMIFFTALLVLSLAACNGGTELADTTHSAASVTENGEIIVEKNYYRYSEDGDISLGGFYFFEDGAVDVDYPDETLYGCLYDIEGDKITICYPDGTELLTLTIMDTFRLVDEDGFTFYLEVF